MAAARRLARVGFAVLLGLAAVTLGGTGSVAGTPPDPLVEAVGQLDRNSEWSVVERIPLRFPTHHPQGFARVGDRLFLSTVEVIEAPVRGPQPDGHDRTPGRGRGHLLVLDLEGRLQADILLGEGTIYHPGGIDVDTDGSVWVPVAEYRPDSRSIVYTVDAETLKVTERFRFDDHVGAILRDPGSGRLHGASWGSRTLFTWSAGGELERSSRNPSHYVDFQDCAAAGAGHAVCTGITEYDTASGGRFDLGGIAVLDLAHDRLGAEVPVTVLSPAGHVVTRNPVHLEVEGDTLRMLAAPDDAEEPGGTTLLILETTLSSD